MFSLTHKQHTVCPAGARDSRSTSRADSHLRTWFLKLSAHRRTSFYVLKQMMHISFESHLVIWAQQGRSHTSMSSLRQISAPTVTARQDQIRKVHLKTQLHSHHQQSQTCASLVRHLLLKCSVPVRVVSKYSIIPPTKCTCNCNC